MKSLFLLPVVLFASSVIADVSQNITIENSFARSAIKQQRNSASFMKITNGGEAATIVYAKSPVAKVVELHTHINDKGVMRMRKINQIDLPAGGSVSLQPGGLHVMMMGLNRDLKPGEEIDVILGFGDGSEKSLKVPVRTVNMSKMKGINDHKMAGDKPMKMTH